MKLIIGGYAQGKRDYVLKKYHLKNEMVWDGVLLQDTEPQTETVVIDHFHRWVGKRILEGGCPEEEIMAFVNCHADCIVISDEIGNGIVPVEPFEREYRERMGRILIRLAGEAEEVERVICGIGQKIK